MEVDVFSGNWYNTALQYFPVNSWVDGVVLLATVVAEIFTHSECEPSHCKLPRNTPLGIFAVASNTEIIEMSMFIYLNHTLEDVDWY